MTLGFGGNSTIGRRDLRLAGAVLLWGMIPMTCASPPVRELTDLRGLPAATRELKESEQAAACQALEKSLTAYLRAGWSVAGKRCFLLPAEINWVSTEKFVANELEPQGAKRQRFEWHRPGYDHFAVWKLGWLRPAYLAVAFAPEQVDGQVVAGYFALERQ